MKIILLGEPMGIFIANELGELSDVSTFTSDVAGAEFNVATGLSRLGHEAVYCTKLGTDPFGDKIMNAIKKNGIIADFVMRDSENLTGFMLKNKVIDGDPKIAYYRKGSAVSKITPEDIDSLNLSDSKWLHVTGITPAISQSALESVKRLIERAKEQKMFISFDPNLRPQLWSSEKEMIDTLNLLAESADLVLPGLKEGEILSGRKGAKEVANFYHDMGAKYVVVKLGDKGAYYSEKDGESGEMPCFKVNEIVDTVGAGDGFAAGVISALAEGKSLKDAAYRGLVIGAIQITHKSDNEGLPTKQELADIIEQGYI